MIKEILLGNQKFIVINLNQDLHQGTEVYPGDPTPRLNMVFCDIRDTGFQYHLQLIGDHNFRPHADSPSHQNPELQKRGTEYWGLERVFNKAAMIDVSNSPESKTFEGIKFLTEVEEKHLSPYASLLKDKTAVVIRTGYDKWLEANYPHETSRIPYLTPDAADFISQFENLRVFATDSLTVDVNPVHITEKAPTPHYTHKKFKDLMIVESLVKLRYIPLDRRNNFDLITSPIKVVGATGCPIAAYALFQNR